MHEWERYHRTHRGPNTYYRTVEGITTDMFDKLGSSQVWSLDLRQCPALALSPHMIPGRDVSHTTSTRRPEYLALILQVFVHFPRSGTETPTWWLPGGREARTRDKQSTSVTPLFSPTTFLSPSTYRSDALPSLGTYWMFDGLVKRGIA